MCATESDFVPPWKRACQKAFNSALYYEFFVTITEVDPMTDSTCFQVLYMARSCCLSPVDWAYASFHDWDQNSIGTVCSRLFMP
jgi:hypothetical protein